ncbi:MAG: TonB-dependent receptor [Ginsengibacter sp.]
MLQKFLNITFLSGLCVQGFTQGIPTDTTAKKLEEVFITATRTPTSTVRIPLPVQVISRKSIQASGSQKLVDILQQQAGLILVQNPLGAALQGYPNPFGSGIEIQGLDPAYTLILVDGEPLTGRNAGILNLDRISTGNIKQVEIVKGPSTSLYGSAAMAGVINIITERPDSNKAEMQVHYASNNTLSLTADALIKTRKASMQLFGNRYSSDGYDLDKNIYGKTVDPFVSYSFTGKIYVPLSEKIELQASGRLFTQKQMNKYLVYTMQQPEGVKGNTTENDQSISTRLKYIFSGNLKAEAKLYGSWYANNGIVFTEKNNDVFEKVYLNQSFLQPEIQVEAGKKDKDKFITGAGYNFETISSSRYASKKNLDAWYMYAQQELHFTQNINIIAGARFDKSSLYKAQVNPKLAIGYKVRQLFFNASVGTGFKTPDFRQQFLNFSNSLVGYTLLGANELSNGLIQLKQNGQIDPMVNIEPYLGSHLLAPEKSVGINLGMRYTPTPYTILKLNVFRNDIRNLIESYNLPFTKVNGQAIFSYVNVSKVFTQGLDINVRQAMSSAFEISGGYQLLIARDKEVVQNIKDGKVYKRDPQPPYVTTLVTDKEYKGLFNRSKNSANVQLTYTNKKQRFGVNVRSNYRGRFGFNDVNGNSILDDQREFASGYVMLNATISKRLMKALDLQVGSENMLNHTDKDTLPGMSGRTYFIRCNFKLENLNSL